MAPSNNSITEFCSSIADYEGAANSIINSYAANYGGSASGSSIGTFGNEEKKRDTSEFPYQHRGKMYRREKRIHTITSEVRDGDIVMYINEKLDDWIIGEIVFIYTYYPYKTREIFLFNNTFGKDYFSSSAIMKGYSNAINLYSPVLGSKIGHARLWLLQEEKKETREECAQEEVPSKNTTKKTEYGLFYTDTEYTS